MERTIGLYLISGFLGAGKTTFLQKALKGFEGLKLGILINEFGSVGIDSTVIDAAGNEIVEINNGSIFCMCLKAGFLKALTEFSKKPIDALFIENSGLGDPSNIRKLLAEAEPYTEAKYVYRGAVCVVDCTTYLEYADVLPPVENQVRSSRFILINKTDLADAERIAAVRSAVLSVNPEACLYETVYGEIPPEILSKELFPSEFSGESSNKPWNGPAVYLIAAQEPVEREALQTFTEAILAVSAARVKGYVPAARGGFFHVDGAGNTADIRPADEVLPEKQVLVLIGKNRKAFDRTACSLWTEHVGARMELTGE